MGPVYGDTPQPSHDGAEGAFENGIFTHPSEIGFEHKSCEQGEGQVPVGGVWGCNYDAFRDVRHFSFYLPAGGLEADGGYPSHDIFDNGGVEKGVIQKIKFLDLLWFKGINQNILLIF